jgi:glycosyltransferase involved in cell wall biosynthesis
MQTSSDLNHPRYKICHLTSVHPYDDTRIYIKECSTLVKVGYETHLVAPDAPNEVREKIHLHSVPQSKNNRLQRMTNTVWNVYQQAIEIDADIYHFHDPELIPVGLILKTRGKKVIYDVHEDVPRQILSKSYIPKIFRSLISRAIESLENFASKYFDGIIAATPFICDRFSKIGWHVANINNFPILNELNIAENNWGQKKRAVCYVGGIGYERGIFEMVAAIGKTETCLLLAGKFTQLEQRDKAIEMSGWTNVQELGYLNRNQIAQTLAQSMGGLVVLHPIANYLDALPVKMFEYMCAGIPVIASNFPLWKKIIEENQCGICVDAVNPEEIASAITWIVDNPEQAHLMGQNGLRAVQEKYNWGNEEKKLCAFYHEIIFTINIAR